MHLHLPSDDKLASLISSHGYEVYRGQEENVLNRMMLGINDNPEYDIVLRVTGDDILIDPDYLEKTIENFKLNNSDYTPDAKIFLVVQRLKSLVGRCLNLYMIMR